MATTTRAKPFTLDFSAASDLHDLQSQLTKLLTDADFMFQQLYTDLANVASAGVAETDINLTDVTTDNVSILRHGFAPKAPNDATKFLNGVGAYSAAGGGGGQITLLKANDGTSVATTGTNLDTFAVTGLTTKDILWVIFNVSGEGGAVSGCCLRNDTDTINFNLNSIGNGADAMIKAMLANSQGALTRVDYMQEGWTGASNLQSATMRQAFVTNWTGNWTLALHYNSLTGGSMTWRWRVFKIAGQ